MKHLTASISEEKRQYIPITFDLIDSGYGGISGDALALYLAMRRFVCRTENHRLGGYFKAGLLVSAGWLENWTRYVGGCSRSKISRLSDCLEGVGLITKIVTRGEEPIFVLGEWKKVEFGNESVILEYFYADFVEMEKRVVAPVQQLCNNSATTLQPSNIEVEKYSSIEGNSPQFPRVDPLSLELECATKKAQAEFGNYAVPPEAGGTDRWADGPVDAFAEVLAGIIPIMLPEKERKSWARKLGQVAARWSTEDHPISPEIMTAAIRAVPDSDIGWKTFKSPFVSSFETDIGALLLNGGKPGRSGGAPTNDLSPAQRAILISRQHDEERNQRSGQR